MLQNQTPEMVALSASAWIGIVGGVVGILAAAIAFPVAWGKVVQKLNGFGERQEKLEKAHEKAEGERETMQRQIDRVLTQHDGLIRQLGEAKRSTEKCSEETVDLGIAIGSKIDTLSREVNGMNLHLSQRIKAVETVLKIKGES